MEHDLRGRVALITGASRGIGAALAVHLASMGVQVAITARTLDEGDSRLDGSLSATLTRAAATGTRAHLVVADLSDERDRARIVPEVTEALGPVDILVNNAAAAFYAAAEEIPLKRRRLMLEINLHAPVDLAQAVVPGMREQAWGRIVNVSSATAKFDTASQAAFMAATAYRTSKTALERYTIGLAAELAGTGIAVNAVAPVAAVRTEGAVAIMGDVLDQLDEGYFEPVDDVVLAITALCRCDGRETGRILTSREVLAGMMGV